MHGFTVASFSAYSSFKLLHQFDNFLLARVTMKDQILINGE